ncbi:MAG: hypothetical protein WCG06_06695, partial [Candidatus Omnitrophota bacterium]
FLIGLGSVLGLHSAWKGMLFFSIFFLGTSVYFVPLLGVGALAKIGQVRTACRAGGVIAGIVFLAGSIGRFLK